MINVIIANDHPLMRTGTEKAFLDEADIIILKHQ
jgi:DNA-binding NarL/FixJ family response regulator